MVNARSLESYQEARVVLDCVLIEQLLHFSFPFLLRTSFRLFIQTSRVYHNTVTRIKF